MISYKIPTHGITPETIVGGPMTLIPYKEGEFSHNDDEARQWCEAPDRIFEWCKYEYELPDGYEFLSHPAIDASPRNSSRGTICAKNYVGRLHLQFKDRDHGSDEAVGYVELECASKKLEYRTQYRHMLTEIAEGVTQIYELLMDSNDFAFELYKLKPDTSAESLYQRFAFLRSLIDGGDFKSAMTRIMVQPIRQMRSVESEVRAGTVKRITPAVGRQIVRSGGGLSVRYLTVEEREETCDTPENRFVKCVLLLFADCVNDIAEHNNASDVLKREAARLSEELSRYLMTGVMREVRDVAEVGAPSVAMQRREGYRDVLKAWLMFDFSSSLQWEGGDDVFKAGTKDVAQLYEYWVFFKLLSIVSEEFKLDPKSVRDLLVAGENGVDLSLKKGTMKIVQGVSSADEGMRQLMVEFTYNRSFKKGSEDGSWSVSMIPDYTLTLWPVETGNERSAADKDLLVHVHFDAKYRISEYTQIFEQLDEKDKEVKTYPRDTILKMHAYNDAVKRTYGSYVLYPGDDSPEQKRRYHEILPGVGAFVLRPDPKDEGVDCEAVRKFIHDVRLALQDRMTQRERIAVYGGKVHKVKPLKNHLDGILLPEKTYDGYPFIPAEQYCLIGFARKNGTLEWAEKYGYNYRICGSRGELVLTPEVLRAEYILIRHQDPVSGTLYRLNHANGMRIVDREELIEKGYPTDPSGSVYLMVGLIPIKAGEPFFGRKFDVSRLAGWQSFGIKDMPFTTTIEDLVTKAILP